MFYSLVISIIHLSIALSFLWAFSHKLRVCALHHLATTRGNTLSCSSIKWFDLHGASTVVVKSDCLIEIWTHYVNIEAMDHK